MHTCTASLQQAPAPAVELPRQLPQGGQWPSSSTGARLPPPPLQFPPPSGIVANRAKKPRLKLPWAPLLSQDDILRGLTYYGTGERLRAVAAKLLAGKPIKVVWAATGAQAAAASAAPSANPDCATSACRPTPWVEASPTAEGPQASRTAMRIDSSTSSETAFRTSAPGGRGCEGGPVVQLKIHLLALKILTALACALRRGAGSMSWSTAAWVPPAAASLPRAGGAGWTRAPISSSWSSASTTPRMRPSPAPSAAPTSSWCAPCCACRAALPCCSCTTTAGGTLCPAAER